MHFKTSVIFVQDTVNYKIGLYLTWPVGQPFSSYESFIANLTRDLPKYTVYL
jgi:hypothetical protein